jgi:hypothetical protein
MPPTTSAPIALAPEDGLLILQNGEVIRGKITHSGNRYYVALPNGELRIRAEDVAIRCRDLEDGYQQKLAALKGNRADEHLDLAQWCLTHQLYEEAETEIRHAATLDDRHPRIRLLARRLELARTEPAQPAPAAGAPAVEEDLAELDRLAKETPTAVMRGFTTQVQPLLLNSCATTGCHGIGAKSEFTLARLRGHGERSRRQTLRNLLAVLGQIDAKNAQESALLTKPIDVHGGGKTPVFTERNSRAYYELFQWARLAAGETREDKASPSTPGDSSAVQAASFDEEVEQEIAGEADPLDPDEFNREFGAAP